MSNVSVLLHVSLQLLTGLSLACITSKDGEKENRADVEEGAQALLL